MTRPPRFARALLDRVLPSDVRDTIIGDLHEVFERDCRTHGAWRARLHYWRKASSFSARFLVDRLRSRVRPGLSWMDVKLGVRMLIKYPGLTLVAGLAMAFAIAVGAAAFEFVNQVVYPRLPLHEGDRIVGIRLWHTATSGVEEQALYDFTTWRGRLETLDDLGAFRTVERNLIGTDASGDPVMTAETTASAFALARVPALLGRTLVEADELAGAPPVVVIGYDVWQARFAGDPGVIGRTVQVGTTPSTVVGVMPEGFGFPRVHGLWIPLRLGDLLFGRRQGPWVKVFGRLAPDVTIDEAQAELTALGRRAAADFPDTHEHIQPEVLPYGRTVSPILDELSPTTLLSMNLFFVMLVALVSANVALLMFARAASREGEMAVRTALGASRGRIVGQLTVEALALGGVAAAAGLAAAGAVLRWWLAVSREENGGELPFWYSDGLSIPTVLYAVALTVIGAGLAGATSALKVTGRGIEGRLRQASAGGGGPRFGGIWTAVIVTQVAVTVAFPATAYFVRRGVVQVRSVDAGFPAAQFLSARLEMSPEFVRESDGVIRAVFPADRFRAACEDLARRIAAAPGIRGVTFADRLPRTHHSSRRIELDGAEPPSGASAGRRASRISVDARYFDVLGAPMLAGRAFTSGDVSSDPPVVIVNESFVREMIGGANPVGRRVREMPDEPDTGVPGPWLEIVGVVRDLGVVTGNLNGRAGFYRPAAPGTTQPAHVIAHVHGEMATTAARLREIAAAVDPVLRLHDVAPLDEVDRTLWLEMDFLFTLLVVVSSLALLLSLAGIYSAMSFAVSRRTREIGIRLALGADALGVGRAILSRSIAHVALGVAAGGALTVVLAILVSGLSARGAALGVAYAALMMGVCLLAGIAPARRALRVEPTEALKEGG